MAIGKIGNGYKRLDLVTDKSHSQGFKNLVFAHKFSLAGQTDIALTSLSTPSEMTGFSNPSTLDLLSANIALNRQNLRLVSSVNGELLDYISYDVITNTTIRLKNGAESQPNEIIVGYITPVNMTGLLAIQGNAIVQTGTLAVGDTDIVVNQPFTYNKYSDQQIGDVQLVLDGVLQMRNVGNLFSGQGNYYEIAPSGGNLSNTLRVNVAPIGFPKNYAIISTGLTTQAPTSQGLAKLDSVLSQLDAIILDLALATGNPTSKYLPTGPSNVDLSMFGQLVKSFITEVHYDAVVGSTTQFNAGKCSFTSVQTAINTVSSGARILVLQGTYTENVTVNKKVALVGKSHGSFIDGTLTVTPSGSLSLVQHLRWGDDITLQASANSIFVSECWQVTGKTITDLGTGNSISVAQE